MPLGFYQFFGLIELIFFSLNFFSVVPVTANNRSYISRGPKIFYSWLRYARLLPFKHFQQFFKNYIYTSLESSYVLVWRMPGIPKLRCQTKILLIF